MNVRHVMSKDSACCTPGTSLQQVARLMRERDCGEIPVVENLQTMKPVGVVTDRDIAIRVVALGKNPLTLTARDCMSTPVVTVTPDTTLEDCCRVMEYKQIRRVPVVDERGASCGIVAQADVVRRAPPKEAAHVVRAVSAPAAMTGKASFI